MRSIGSGFPYIELGKLVDENRGITYGVVQPGQHTENGIPIIRVNNFANNSLQLNDVMKIDTEISKRYQRTELQGGEILISLVGTIGKCIIAPKDVKGWNVARAVGVIPLKDSINPKWVLYALKSPYGQSFIYDRLNTTVQATFNLRDLALLPIPYPDKNIQNNISDTLSCLDGKIELNNKMNTNLEAQAQAIFKSWFIDFKPWGGEQPKSWRAGSLTDIADYINGLAMQRFRPFEGEEGLPVLKIKELRQGICDSSSELCSPSIRSDYIVHDGDVIFSWSGSLLVDFWCGGDCGLNQHLFKVTSTKYDKWFYYVWTCHHLTQFIAMAADKATTMGHIKREALENAEVIIPDNISYHQIGDLLAPLYEQIINNRVESRKLALIRDSLLPKLMTGKHLEEAV